MIVCFTFFAAILIGQFVKTVTVIDSCENSSDTIMVRIHSKFFSIVIFMGIELYLWLMGLTCPIIFPWISGNTVAYLSTGTNQFALKILKLFIKSIITFVLKS